MTTPFFKPPTLTQQLILLISEWLWFLTCIMMLRYVWNALAPSDPITFKTSLAILILFVCTIRLTVQMARD